MTHQQLCFWLAADQEVKVKCLGIPQRCFCVQVLQENSVSSHNVSVTADPQCQRERGELLVSVGTWRHRVVGLVLALSKEEETGAQTDPTCFYIKMKSVSWRTLCVSGDNRTEDRTNRTRTTETVLSPGRACCSLVSLFNTSCCKVTQRHKQEVDQDWVSLTCAGVQSEQHHEEEPVQNEAFRVTCWVIETIIRWIWVNTMTAALQHQVITVNTDSKSRTVNLWFFYLNTTVLWLLWKTNFPVCGTLNKYWFWFWFWSLAPDSDSDPSRLHRAAQIWRSQSV